MAERRKRVFSGIQPSGRSHIGNYLGAIRSYVEMQDEYDCIFGIVDYHAMTTVHDGELLRQQTRDMLLDLLACGLDPQRCIIMRQSDVPEHAELAWILGTITPLAWVERCPTFKEKKQQRAKDVNFGLLAYPLLMAADILIYKTEVVPVGKDQLPHLELTREIARSFNATYGPTFPEPVEMVRQETATVLGIDGKKKMSKSADNQIEVFLPPEEMQARVMKMVTDPSKIYKGDPGHPEICNVQTFHRIFGQAERVEQLAAECRKGTLGCVEHKRLLAEDMTRFFAPMRERRQELERNPSLADDVIADGRKRARELALAVMEEVRTKTGLR